MGVYIRDMEKPKDPWDCLCRNAEYGHCRLKPIKCDRQIPTDCPLIEIVRCEECKYQVKQWHEDNRMKSKGFYYYRCDRNEDPFVAHTVNGEPNDFCSKGERRADE